MHPKPRPRCWWVACWLACSLSCLVSVPSSAQQDAPDQGGAGPVADTDSDAESRAGTPSAVLVALDGPIGPASSGFFEQAHADAVASGARFLVLRIDTPGGLDASMRDIVRTILSSPIPVIGYVSPGGARAASAGTYILLATHVAAMAPTTNLGSATPVPVGGGAPKLPSPGGKDGDEKDGDAASDRDQEPSAEEPSEPGDAMSRKVINDAVAYIRGLAERRGRNAEWAEKAVRQGANLTATAALEVGVIDLVVPDLPALLDAIHGRQVQTSLGAFELQSRGVALREIEPDWRFELLAILASPTLAYMLLLVGVYGLLLEGYNPGAVLPGVVGAISLLLGLFALQILPVNYVGLALMALGIVLMIAEVMVPSFGALGFGGIAAFVFGSVMLMDADVPGYGVNRGLIAGLALGASGLMALTLYLLSRSRQSVVVTGNSPLLGRSVQVLSFADGSGRARLGGENWVIRSRHPLATGDRARVVRVEGLSLHVEPES